MRWRLVVAGALLLGLHPAAAAAATRLVGPGHPYEKPCQAIAASKPGDVVKIDARGNGSYDGDVCASSVPHLTIEGFHGRARIAAAGHDSEGKAIWVLSGPDTTVRDVELSGASVPDRNGAAIRLEGDGDLRLSRSYLHDNEDGILVTGSDRTDVTITSTQLRRNGAGDGQSHNIYVARAHRFTLRYSWSRDARVGHLVKSRAQINDIEFNRLTGEGGTSSYELDLPDGGTARVVGNVIEQGPKTENGAMLAYAEESARNPRSRLTVAANTFVSDRPGGGTAIMVGAAMTAPIDVVGNVAVGQTTFVTQASARLRANCLPRDARFVDPRRFDYHLRASSPCRDTGTRRVPGGLPHTQYVYDLRHAARRVAGRAPDAGAFESGRGRRG